MIAHTAKCFMTSSPPSPTVIDDRQVLALRGQRNAVDPLRPYLYLVEPERTAGGEVEDVATIFISNKTCPFRCLMCDLWKNTTPERVPDGAVVEQIRWALAQMPRVRHIKLYNAGNFFDGQAIPKADLQGISDLMGNMDNVIVECHPRLIDQRCLAFADRLEGRLHVAIGLETVDPGVLPRLNKRMTLADFQRASQYLVDHDIMVRCFILLPAPFQSPEDGIHWAKRSIDYAFSAGVECCAIVPTRAGNGVMDRLLRQGEFHPPTLPGLEEVHDYGISLGLGRVFIDLWDIEKLMGCKRCGPDRIERMRRMNFGQSLLPKIECDCGRR